jgi:hypothetical protein
MFPDEVQVQIDPPGQESIFLFTSTRSTSTGAPVTAAGVAGTVFGNMVGEYDDKVVVDLPGEVRPIGPRVRLAKTFVRLAD